MDLAVGPIRIEVIEPLHRVRLVIDDHQGISADLVFESRSAPVQEPRFTRRQGPRLFMDLTRFTQNVWWSGWISIDGKRTDYAAAPGTRDRSWGVRSIGAPDAQPVVPATIPQFYWLWAPTNFPNLSLYAHVNEDAAGVPWNLRASIMLDGAAQGGAQHLVDPKFIVDWTPGTRHARAARLEAQDAAGRDHLVRWTPLATFQMKGIGYGHPGWAHGGWKGELAVEREDFVPDSLDRLELANLHIQAICSARHDGGGAGSDGIGLFEQLVIGAHSPSGFVGLNDGAA